MFKIGPNPCGRQPRPDCFDCQDCPGQDPLTGQDRIDILHQLNNGELVSKDVIFLHSCRLLTEDDMQELCELCWE